MAQRHLAALLLGGLMTVSAVLLLAVRSNLGFLLDDWAFVIYRSDGGIGDFLEPHNEHISILPVTIYKLLLSVFGMSSAMPFHVVAVAAFLLAVVAVFWYLRPMVGDPVAVIACAVILFLGSAWEDLLWAFQMGFSLSLAGGIGALVMLRREDRTGDLLACLLLCVSVISTSLGLAFLAGAAVELLLRRDRRLKRLWVLAVPASIYAAWWIGWGHEAKTTITGSNALGIPAYLFDSFQLTFAELNGSFRIDSDLGGVLTRVIGALVLIGLGTWLYMKRRLPLPLLVALAIALVFWGLTALNLHPGRAFDSSRYQLPGVIFLIMILAGAFDGVRPGSRTVFAVAAVACVGIVCNLFAMQDGYDRYFKPLSDKGIAGITALDLPLGQVNPDYLIGISENDVAKINAQGLFNAEERYGDSPGWNEDEIEAAPKRARNHLDQVLVGALPVSHVEVPAPAGDCRKRVATPAGDRSFPVPSPVFFIKPERNPVVLLGRFGDGAKAITAFTEPGKTLRMRIPPDRANEPWRIAFKGEGGVLVCRVGPG